MARAIGFTLLAWVVGLFADANLPFEPNGYLMLRLLFPLLAMGGFILAGQNKKDK